MMGCNKKNRKMNIVCILNSRNIFMGSVKKVNSKEMTSKDWLVGLITMLPMFAYFTIIPMLIEFVQEKNGALFAFSVNSAWSSVFFF